jgi:hypothetical protein
MYFIGLVDVPPGHRLDLANKRTVPCKTGAEGEYKAGWDQSTSCTRCGIGVFSETADWISIFNVDGSTDILDVAGSPESCCEWSRQALVIQGDMF